ncbi:hypothetical protein [Solitalea canadensis]|uniref:hypothetical protein n=1 Tax=Solitalea canadensis TaxID=995 RepID=UPI0012F7BAE6|nr:hypothetical protein [Solitalea canadensis]
MNDQFFSGKWSGHYMYGDTYPDGIRHTSTPFIINMTVINGNLKGTCEDIFGTNVFEDTAVITGFIEDNFTSFIKEYPCLMQFDEHMQRKVFPEFPSQKIHYSGVFEDGKFVGEWDMDMSFEDHDGNIITIMHAGTWVMEKCS